MREAEAEYVGAASRTAFPLVSKPLRCLAQFIKMLGGDVDSAVEPADRPAVKVEAVEHGLVAQRGKELVLFDEGQAVEDALAAVVEGQVQPVAVKRVGGYDPFQNVFLFHIA